MTSSCGRLSMQIPEIQAGIWYVSIVVTAVVVIDLIPC
jgi:hypothetical protein